MILKTVTAYFFYFVLYSCFGWIYETVLCSAEAHHAVNRGFLNGPYCPIYGAGSILFITLLGREANALLIFLFGALIACAIEYATSFAMEKMFSARWWDYSRYKFNLNGRICLGAAAVFGAFAVLLIKFIHPFVLGVLKAVPYPVFVALSIAAFVIFALDFFITVKGFSGFNGKLKAYTDGAASSADGEFEEPMLSRQQKRMIKAFPTMTSLNYNDSLSSYRERLQKSSSSENKKRKTT